MKLLSVEDNTVEAKDLRSFTKKKGKASFKAVGTYPTTVMKKLERAMKTNPEKSSAAVSRKHEAVFSTIPEVIRFIMLVMVGFLEKKWEAKTKIKSYVFYCNRKRNISYYQVVSIRTTRTEY